MARTLKQLWRALGRPGLFMDPDVVSGEYSVYELDGDRRRPLFSKQNLILYTWGFIAAKCIGQGNAAYKVSAAYLEYENVANPADPVSVPSFSRGDGLPYYNGLSGNRDYLRVALSGTPAIDIASGFESYFTAGVSGNRCTFSFQSAGTQGVLGRPFANGNNSKACGIALVATPLASDRLQDVVLCRGYFEVADQIVKGVSTQIGVDWKVTFK